jgi:hypothetical protein
MAQDVLAARAVLVALSLAAIPGDLAAQMIVAVDGRDEFQRVEYVGGDASQPKKEYGWLVLTDSTIAIHGCPQVACPHDKKRRYYREEPEYTVHLRHITEVTSSSQVRGPSTGSRLALGFLAGDRTEEFVGLVYETENAVEAPVFKTQRAQSAALEAKIKFRLKRLGVELVPAQGASADQP